MGIILKLSRKSQMEEAVELSKKLLTDSLKERSLKEKLKMKALGKMAKDPQGISFVTALTDQCFRAKSDPRTAEQLKFLLENLSTPDFLPAEERVGFFLFHLLGTQFPSFFVPRLKKKIFQEMSSFFKKKKDPSFSLNLNHLGEAVLGEEEALARLQLYLKSIEDPEIDALSIKISTLYSQINLVSFTHTLNVLKERLRTLYRAAGKKLIYLDMEEYKDLELTIRLFKETLSEEEFSMQSGGIVLQSYLPDAFAWQKDLTEWAKTRKAPIRIRLVKGANLSMENVESSLRGWERAPFETKIETDANFLRMLEYGLEKENAKVAHIGIGSHNLFDIAYAMLLRKERGVEDFSGFEMLEGMNEPLKRVLQKKGFPLLIYSPEVSLENFPYAAPYLIRRLDENVSPENYLRHIFDLKVGSSSWNKQVELFLAAEPLVDRLPCSKKRAQNRSIPSDKIYSNEPDTDFSLEENRTWAFSIYEQWKESSLPKIPLVDKTEKILFSAKLWTSDLSERSRILSRVANLLRSKRGDLIGAMMKEGTKVFEEGDVEVSEAIDFVEYYRHEGEETFTSNHLSWKPKGILLVAPPWNFPLSIPVGGIAAALMAGNAVLFKPAPETVFIGSLIAQLFWDAGVPKEVLQFVPCEDEPTGSALIADPRLNGVILTGATETALKFLKLHPGLDLMAETGGKNAMIITALADRDLAISDVVKSAFGHAGQKCSACSLLILEAEVYDDPHFLSQLKDATASLIVGSALDPKTKVPPLIRKPDPSIFQLDEGESWLLEPRQDPLNPLLYSPGIKLGVLPHSRTHQTEFFAPILGLMRAESLNHAIVLANGTPYGLTSGLHSLDVREHEIWKKEIVAGNLYINRTITGAIVHRQPFGGTKASSFGPGAKAGGPHYLSQMALPKQESLPKATFPLPPSLASLISQLPQLGLTPEEIRIWKASVENYAYWAKKLKEPEDLSKILGQDNFFYLKPHEKMVLRVREDDSRLDLLRVIGACICAGTPLEISCEEPFFDHPQIQWKVEERRNFLSRVKKGHVKRIRLVHTPSMQLREKAALGGAYIAWQPVLASGRFELLHYMREVCLSMNTHRYGYIANPSMK